MDFVNSQKKYESFGNYTNKFKEQIMTILQSSIHPTTKPYFNRHKKIKYSNIRWTDGCIDRFQSKQLDEIMSPILKQIEKMFDDNKKRLPRSSNLLTGAVAGHWFDVPNDIGDIIERMILEGHEEYMRIRKPTRIEDY